MSSRSRVLDLNLAVRGMSLADDVKDAHGAILLPRGTVISEASILSMRVWGIEKITVADQDGLAADPALRRQRVQARLDSLFRKCRGPQACEALLQCVMQYRQGASQ